MDDDGLRRLVEGARGGDADAFGRIVEAFEADVMRWIRRRLDPALRAKFDEMDVLQSAVREAFAGARQLEFRDSPALRNWLLLHASRKLASKRATYAAQKRRVHDEVAGGDAFREGSGPRDRSPGPATRAAASERDRIVRDCVETLEEPYRTVMLLELQGENAEAIAEALARPAATVRTQRIEGRRRLITKLRQRLPAEPS